MKVLRYISAIWVLLFALTLAPLAAQEVSEPAETAADSDTDDSPKKKKKKKKKKKSKSKKSTKADKESREEPETDESETKEDAPAENAVVAAFNKFNNIGGKLNQNADYYIYFATSSTCVHCQRCMPIAVEQYKKMRSGRKVELIVISADNTEAAAKQHLKSHKMKNACMMFSALQATQMQGLPGCGLLLPPSVAIVSKDGTPVKQAVGAQQVIDTLSNWKSFTNAAK